LEEHCLLAASYYYELSELVVYIDQPQSRPPTVAHYHPELHCSAGGLPFRFAIDLEGKQSGRVVAGRWPAERQLLTAVGCSTFH
jgi:hypothetical protein